MAPSAVVRLAAGDEELTTAGRKRRPAAAPHPPEGQETKHDEVNQGDDEPLEQSDGFLIGNAAGQVSAERAMKWAIRQGVGSKANVGVDENEQRVARLA